MRQHGGRFSGHPKNLIEAGKHRRCVVRGCRLTGAIGLVGARFRDFDAAPEMIVVPGGSFLMGLGKLRFKRHDASVQIPAQSVGSSRHARQCVGIVRGQLAPELSECSRRWIGMEGRGHVFPRSARRFVEQRSTQPPLGEPQQEPPRQPQQQGRLPGCQHALCRSCRDQGPDGCAV
jgi:hypothetical protein